MQLRTPSRARFLRVALPAATAIALIGPVTPAHAVPVSLDLTYTCNFPLLKPQPLTLHISSDIPTEVGVGKPTGAFAIKATATVSAGSVKGLRAVDAVSVEGTALAYTDVIQPTGSILVAKVPTTVAKTDLPLSGAFNTDAVGATPSLQFSKAGTVKLNVKDLLLTLTPRLADGTLTGVDTFETECAQDPGQQNTLATIAVTDGVVPVSTAYSLSGIAYLKTLAQGTVPVTGTVSTTRNASTGALTGDVALDPARASLKALNLLPVKASFIFTSTGGATGTLPADNTFSFTTKQDIRMTNVSVFGINLVSGTCHTSSPASITLASKAGAFPPDVGGSVLSTFTIPSLTGCGSLGAIVSGLTAGAGNALSAKLTPKPAA